MAFNFVADLKPKDKDKMIEVKVYRTWTIKYPPNPAPKGFSCILLDKTRNAIQANMDVNDMEYFKPILQENKAYNISNFIYYIGCIQTVGDVVRSRDPNKNQVDRRTIDITNLNGNMVQLTMWDTMATNFDKDCFVSMPKPVMIAVTFCRVQEYRNQLQLSATQATHYYLNPNIEEVKQSLPEYKAKFDVNPPLEVVKQKYTDNEKEKTRNRFSLSVLVTQNPETYKSIRFTCEGSILNLSTTHNWFHYTCTECNKKLISDTSPFECREHGLQPKPNIRYSFKATVTDNSTTAPFFSLDPMQTLLLIFNVGS